MVNGLWVIERIEETQTRQIVNGAPRRVEFRLNLRKYGSAGDA